MAVELYKHNKKAYEKINKHLEKSNRTCVIHPTGSGKSMLSLKFIEENIKNNILLLAPTYSILDQFNRNIAKHILKMNIKKITQKEINQIVAERFPNIKFSIYSNVDKLSEIKFDNIIMDEFHRVGADEWGKSVNKLLDNNKEAKILGVSATPIRYLDDNRDMSKEIFNGDVASEITLPEAIAKGILPTPTYINAIYSFEEDIDQIEKQINNYKDKSKISEFQETLSQAKQRIQDSYGLDEIFKNNITNKNGKFIIFCKNIKHMKEMEEKCIDWFNNINSNIEISDVYSEKGKELNQYTIDYFENNEKKTLKLLFSVEMLNEGLHVSNIDGVIMFRPTESPIIYLQQLGRALSVGHNDNPLIFDIVNNSTALNSILDIKKEVFNIINTIINERKNGNVCDDYPDNEELNKIIDKFKIIEEKKEIIELLENLKVETKFTWDDWYDLAKKYYDHHGDLEIPENFKTTNGYEYDDDGVSLGSWILNQRNAYKELGNRKITKDRVELLNEIRMRWENKDTMENWLEYYNLAKAYYEYHGDLEIPTEFKTTNGYEYDEVGVNLGYWIVRQRQAYKGNAEGIKITKEQKNLLDEIEMRWENKDTMENWLEYYNLAKTYYDYYGNLEIPYDFKTINGYEYEEEGIKLGSWIANQRAAYKGTNRGNLSEEKIKLLNEIEMRWENKDVMEKWLEYYNLAKIYFEHHGNLKITSRFKTINGYEYDENGVKLGSWISNQRTAYKCIGRSIITEEQIKLLEQIGMIWFDEKVDNKLQSEEITEKNKLQKEKEIINRVRSLVTKYDKSSLPRKEEINQDFLDRLNRKTL